MILRVHGSDRIMKIEVESTFLIEDIKKEIENRVKSVCDSLEKNGQEIVNGTVEENGLLHGDILQAKYKVEKQESVEPERKQESKLTSQCTHGPTGMCIHCAPEDTWSSVSFKDRRFISQGAYEDYLKSKGKSLEFHEHLPQACRKHPAKTKCNQCISLEIPVTRQVFRPVDHIEIHSKSIMEDLLMEVKETKRQKVCLLVGRYSEYTEVSKGIKAEVFEKIPLKHTSLTNGFILEDNSVLEGEDKSINKVLSELGMTIVGMVYTRIFEEPKPFINALELQFITRMQNQFPEVDQSQKSLDGKQVNGSQKSSKFVTLVLAGTLENCELLEFSAAQLAMELEQQELLKASSNLLFMNVDPLMVAWKRETGMYKGNEIPIEYLIVRPTHGLTTDKSIFYLPSEKNRFKREMGVNKLQKHFQKRMTQEAVKGINLQMLSDLQVLLKLEDMNILPPNLISVILTQDKAKFTDMTLNGEFDSIVEIAKECKDIGNWSCNMCTLENPTTLQECDACGMPRVQE
ncbi:nuclear protein localization protein 4 [Nematocida sp. AWRm80]|nr:nuclear protein localization protein 4 [Nematocida sp. AWRm80]